MQIDRRQKQNNNWTDLRNHAQSPDERHGNNGSSEPVIWEDPLRSLSSCHPPAVFDTIKRASHTEPHQLKRVCPSFCKTVTMKVLPGFQVTTQMRARLRFLPARVTVDFHPLRVFLAFYDFSYQSTEVKVLPSPTQR
jgi:hypothetical protein